MSANPRYTNVANLRWVEDNYAVGEDDDIFDIPLINADNRIVTINVDYKSGQETLNIRLPRRYQLKQKLVLNLKATNNNPLRAIDVQIRSSPQSLTWIALARYEGVFDITAAGSGWTTYFHTTDMSQRWLVDLASDPINYKFVNSSTLTVSGALVSDYDGDYTLGTPLDNILGTRLHNNKPKFFNTEGHTIMYILYFNKFYCIFIKV
jgi:hypothetical protein